MRSRAATCYRSVMGRTGRDNRLKAPLVLALLFVMGCGYRSQLADARSVERSAGADSNSEAQNERESSPTRIAILSLRNDSPEPWLDRVVTDAMRREIAARGDFDFVNDPKRAETILRGRIRPIDTRSKSFSRFVAALEYSLTIQLDLELVRSSGDVVRLDPRMLTESDVYLASPDIEVTRTNRLEALRRLSDVLASRVADSIELIESPIPENAPANANRKEESKGAGG